VIVHINHTVLNNRIVSGIWL